MTERSKQLTKDTTLSIGLFIALAGMIFCGGILWNRVANLEHEVSVAQAKDTPTRTEFEKMGDDIVYIRNAVDNLEKKN